MLSIYRLPNKSPNEKIIKVLRRDYFILFKKVLLLALLAALPLVLFIILLFGGFNLLSSLFFYSLAVLGLSAYYLFIWLFFFFNFIDYYLDVWIITNERIIDVQQKGFFSRIISEQRLSRVQDVSSEVHGFFPTILKYGDVHIQTAGETQRFLFSEIPNPNGIRDLIIKLIKDYHFQHKGEGKQE